MAHDGRDAVHLKDGGTIRFAGPSSASAWTWLVNFWTDSVAGDTTLLSDGIFSIGSEISCSERAIDGLVLGRFGLICFRTIF